MFTHRKDVLHIRVWISMFLLLTLVACAQSPSPAANRPTRTVGSSPTPSLTSSPISTTLTPPLAKAKTTPTSYTAHLLLRGVGRPDDLAFDQQGRLLFSDEFNGTISRLNADGSITRLLTDPSGPEGMVVRPDGTIIFAEQETNRVMFLAPGSSTPLPLRALPGTPSTVSCKQGTDGIAFDSTTNTLIVPDSPTGTVYRMSLDGKKLTQLATGIVRPVGAGVDSQGTVFIADECGGAVWRITSDGKTTRIGGFGMPDDVISDDSGNLLVIDLKPSIHALIRFNLETGQRQILARQGYIEPQGLVMDTRGNIFVSDDYANVVMKYVLA